MGWFLDQQEQKTRLQEPFYPTSAVRYEFGLFMLMTAAHTVTS
jgi:hypothetical protein